MTSERLQEIRQRLDRYGDDTTPWRTELLEALQHIEKLERERGELLVRAYKFDGRLREESEAESKAADARIETLAHVLKKVEWTSPCCTCRPHHSIRP